MNASTEKDTFTHAYMQSRWIPKGIQGDNQWVKHLGDDEDTEEDPKGWDDSDRWLRGISSRCGSPYQITMVAERATDHGGGDKLEGLPRRRRKDSWISEEKRKTEEVGDKAKSKSSQQPKSDVVTSGIESQEVPKVERILGNWSLEDKKKEILGDPRVIRHEGKRS